LDRQLRSQPRSLAMGLGSLEHRGRIGEKVTSRSRPGASLEAAPSSLETPSALNPANMKQTPLAGLCFRQEPAPTPAVEWRTVRHPSPFAAKPSAKKSAPWGPIIIAAGLVTAALIVANGNKPAPPAAPETVSPSQRLATVYQSEPVVPRAQPVIWPRAEAAGPMTLFSPAWYASPSNRGRWVCQEIPHEGRVWIHYQGQLLSTGQLPQHPSLWDWTPGATWVWMIPAGATTPQWVDP
jgi:hypothetical protein